MHDLVLHHLPPVLSGFTSKVISSVVVVFLQVYQWNDEKLGILFVLQIHCYKSGIIGLPWFFIVYPVENDKNSATFPF